MQDKARLDTLNACYTWPSKHIFKFIIPKKRLKDLEALTKGQLVEIYRRPSKKGNYVAINLESTMDSAEAVLKIYQQAEKIEGLVSI